MQRNLVCILIVFCALASKAQLHSTVKVGKNAISRFVGKYEMEGSIIQFGLQKKDLVLVVPGAPLQPLKYAGKNKFKSTVFDNQIFVFVEQGGKVVEVVSEEKRGTFKGKKISDKVEIWSMAMDSLLPLKKSTDHFRFLYSPMDSIRVDSISMNMEKNYKRILDDFKLAKIPDVVVRIYPDLESFHKGINFPTAPDQILATAFGKNDIRMVSPANAGPEGWMLAYFAPHEFTHCVHLNIDYSPNNPRWLWEGVAQYEAGWFFDPNELEVITKKEFPPLDSLNNGMEYMLGFVIAEAIKDLWGFDTIIRLIKMQGDVQGVLKMDEKLFEKKIYEYIYEKYIKK